MKRLLASLLLWCAATPARAQLSCEPARTALVLAGGGAKGLAHIGLLRTLDSLGVVPDLIVGTSMGAIVGALYASGLNAAEVERALRDEHLEAIIRSYDPVVSSSLEGLQPAIVWEKQGTRWVIQTGAVREGEVSAALARVMLRGNLLARGDFDSLPIPFRAVATELADRSVVSLGRGDLARAVRASMSIPLILRPVQLDGRSLVDGGLSSNVPVGIARSLGAQRVIASTIASPLPDPADFDNPLTVTSALFEYLWVQDSLDLGANDVRVAMPTADFDPLDFSPSAFDTLIATGRRAADAALGAASCLRPINTTRVAPMLPTRIARTRVLPESIREREAVVRELALGNRRSIDTEATATGLARLARNERYRSVWIAPTGDATDVNMDVAVELAPRKSFGLGAAFDHTMSGRLWVGGVDRSLLGSDLEGTALLTAGTYRSDLTLVARRRARVATRYVPIGVSAEISAEDLRVFDANGELPTVASDEQVLVIGVRPLLEPGWSQEFGLDARFWRVARMERQGHLGVRYAVRLREAGAPQPLIALEAIASSKWQRVRLDVSRTRRMGPATLTPRIRAGWGSALPLSQSFTLGGLDGFAGLRMLEGRGDHELFASLLLRWRLWRGVSARLEPMAGLMGTGDWHSDSLHLQGVLLSGARIGVDLDTPLGPIRLEQGFNNLNRRQALIRVGHWF
ncbi:MAG: patatin-like phospholipase family protein [Gemmatimonadaceae bacterium]|nr:patatin-like phospholipase family protein [Gemmatimonadaceae bacterium]